MSGGSRSPRLRSPTFAPAAPRSSVRVDILGRLWGCGRYIFVVGAVPGAVSEVTWDGIVHGSGVAHGREARFALDQGLPAGRKVQVRQRINAAGGPVLDRDVSPLPFPRERPMPAPVILGPIRDCQTAVRVEGVSEGSDVVLTRKSGEHLIAPFDLSGLWVNLPRPPSRPQTAG